MNEEITIEKCNECPLIIIGFQEHTCSMGAFSNLTVNLNNIHPDCPFKNNDTLTFKFQIDE
jgi:hypothetical protein